MRGQEKWASTHSGKRRKEEAKEREGEKKKRSVEMNARPHLQCRQMMRDDNGTQNDEVAAASAVQESRLK